MYIDWTCDEMELRLDSSSVKELTFVRFSILVFRESISGCSFLASSPFRPLAAWTRLSKDFLTLASSSLALPKIQVLDIEFHRVDGVMEIGAGTTYLVSRG